MDTQEEPPDIIGAQDPLHADAWTCSLCLDTTVGVVGTPEAVVVLSCHPKHKLHQQCLDTLESHGEWRCPLCRAPFHPEREDVQLRLWLHQHTTPGAIVFLSISFLAICALAYLSITIQAEKMAKMCSATDLPVNQPSCPGSLFVGADGRMEEPVITVAPYDDTTCTESHVDINGHMFAKGNLEVAGPLTMQGQSVALQKDVEALQARITALQELLILLDEHYQQDLHPPVPKAACGAV